MRSGLQGGNLVEGRFDNIAEKKQQRFFPLSRIQQGLEVCIECGRPAAAGQRDGRFIKDEPADAGSQERSFQGAEPAEGMSEEMHGSSDRFNDGCNVFAFALECVADGIAAVAASAPIESPYGEMAFKRGQYRRPCEMVPGSAVHEQQGLARAAMPARDGYAIL